MQHFMKSWVMKHKSHGIRFIKQNFAGSLKALRECLELARSQSGWSSWQFDMEMLKKDHLNLYICTHLSDVGHLEFISSRDNSCSIIFFFFFLTDSASCGFWSDGSASEWGVRLHKPLWHQSSSWFDTSKCDWTNSLSLVFSPSSPSSFRFFFLFFFFFLPFFSCATDSVGLDCVEGAEDGKVSLSSSTSECRLFLFFFFFFGLMFWARGSRSGSWAAGPRLLEDLGPVGFGLWRPLVLWKRLAFGFCSVEKSGCLWDPHEWEKGDNWALRGLNGLTLGGKEK